MPSVIDFTLSGKSTRLNLPIMRTALEVAVRPHSGVPSS